MPPLTDEQLRHFRDHGYVIAENLVPPHRLELLNRRVDEIVAGRAAASGRLLNRFGRGQRVVLQKVQALVSSDDVFRDFAQDPLMVDVVEELFGEPALIFRDVLVIKPPRDGSKLHWHQDSAYWDIDPPALVSAWVALTDVPAAAGCLRFITGSHKTPVRHSLYWTENRRLPHPVTSMLRKALSYAGTGDNPDHAGGNRLLGELKAAVLERATRFVPLMARIGEFRVDEETIAPMRQREVEVPVRAGTVIFFHSLLLHSSNPNTSDVRRPAPIISYMPASARFVGRGTPTFLPARKSS